MARVSTKVKRAAKRLSLFQRFFLLNKYEEIRYREIDGVYVEPRIKVFRARHRYKIVGVVKCRKKEQAHLMEICRGFRKEISFSSAVKALAGELFIPKNLQPVKKIRRVRKTVVFHEAEPELYRYPERDEYIKGLIEYSNSLAETMQGTAVLNGIDMEISTVQMYRKERVNGSLERKAVPFINAAMKEVDAKKISVQ